MKRKTLMAKLSGIILSGLGALALLASAFAFAPLAPAYADNGTPPTPTPNNGAKADERLAQAYTRTQSWLKEQTDNLGKANDAAVKAQTQIDTLKAKGKHTSTLEAALAAFKTQVVAAQTDHDKAVGILSTHAGFDAQGKVTDRTQARQTLTSARQSLEDAHLTLRQALLDLHVAIRDWRKANAPKK